MTLFSYRERSLLILILILFFFSGINTLILEVVWMRMLSLALGSTHAATTAVLASFVLGMAVGGLWGGRFVDQRKSALKLFGVVQILIAISAMGLPYLFSHINDFVLLIPGYFSDLRLFYRFSVSILFLFIPSFLIGAMFPILLKYFTTQISMVGRNAGQLFFVNTLGAIFGAMITGFFLIETFGLQQTIYLGVVISTAIGGCAITIDYFTKKEKRILNIMPESINKKAESFSEKKQTRSFPFIIGTAVFISGFIFFAYEIVWTRIFSLIFPTTTYAFSLMLISFLTGITLGSWVYYKFLSYKENIETIFGIVELGIGIAMLFLIRFFGYLYTIFDSFSFQFEGDWLKLTLFKFSFMFLTLLIPATLMGMAFPILHKLFIREKAVIGKSSGVLYFINSLGAVTGIVVTAFVVIPLLGMKKGVITLAFINFILGVGFYIRYLKRQNWARKSLLGCSIFAVFFIPTLPQNDLITDLFKYHFKEDGKLVYFNEGSENTVVIAETPDGDRYLIANFNEYVGDTSKVSVNSQKKQGHLPLFIHPDPQKVLFIGFGTGITLGTASLHNIEQIDCVEISENVVEASRYFAEWNDSILKIPRVYLHIEDGRNYILTTYERYDVIVSEVYKAENSGIVNLYTREFLDIAKDRLTSNGIFCQWISLRDLPEAAFKGLINTFAESFQYVSLWSASPGILGLVGSDYKLSLNINQLRARFRDPQIKELYSEDIFYLLSSFITEKKEVQDYAGGARIITDNDPYPEFTIPRTLQYINFENNVSQILLQMAELIKPPINLLDFHNLEEENIEDIKRRLKAYSQAKRHFFMAESLFWAGDEEPSRKEYSKGKRVIKKY